MTREELDRLDSLLAQATPGPWIPDPHDPAGDDTCYWQGGDGQTGNRCTNGADDVRFVTALRNAAPALLAAAREADSLREQCNVAARVASDAMREAEEWKAKALRWDAERQIVAGHYDDVRAHCLELREWQREAAEWFRGELDRSRATEGFLRALLARVKP